MTDMWKRVAEDFRENDPIDDLTIPKVDYYEFGNRWVPLWYQYWLGKKVPMGEWTQNVCRNNPLNEVLIIKDGMDTPDKFFPPLRTISGGKIMFRIPSMFNRDFSIKLDGNRDIGAVLDHADRLGKTIAKAGEKYYKSEVIDKMQVTTNNNDHARNLFMEIFKHYNVDTSELVALSTVATNNTSKVNNINESTDDLIDEDNW